MLPPAKLDDQLAALLGAPTQVVSPLPPRVRDELPEIPDHQLMRRIGQGAYGEVWLARNVLGTFRAVKLVFRDSFSSEEPYEREFRGIQRFEPVSRSHDGLVDLLQAGRDDRRGCFYYVMELADDAANPGSSGGLGKVVHDPEKYLPDTLSTRRRNCSRIPVAGCLEFSLSLASALGHLHRNGLIHRDIKPSNIIFVQGVAKLADIGLVAEIEEALSFVGTEGFIPPEGPTSPQADLYSLGKVLYEACMGKDRKEYPEPMTGLMQSTGREEREALLELNAIILKACAESTSDRYQSAEEMHADLALVQSGRSVRWKRIVESRLAVARKAAAVVAVAAALASGGWMYQHHRTGVEAELRKHAQEQTRLAEATVARLQIQRAETYFQRGDSPHGLAWLAHVLRRHPENRVVAERLMAALSQRRFYRPAHAPQLPVRSAQLSPDGGTIAVTTDDHTIRFLDPRTGLEKCPPFSRKARVNGLQFSPDGQRILTRWEDSTVWVVDAGTGVAALPPFEHESPVATASFSPNGDWIATGTQKAMLRRFSARTGEPVGRPAQLAGNVNALIFHPDSRMMAIALEDGAVVLHSVEDGRLVRSVPLDGLGRRLRFSPDGKWLAVALLNRSGDRSLETDWDVRVWEVTSGRQVAGPLTHDRVTSLAFSPDSARLVTGDATGDVTVWNIPSGQRHFRVRHAAKVNSTVFDSSGRFLLTASEDQTVRTWHAETGQPAIEPVLHDAPVTQAEFSPLTPGILTATKGKSGLRLWRAPPDEPEEVVLPHDRIVVSAILDADGGKALTATGAILLTAGERGVFDYDDPQSVFVWDVVRSAPIQAITFPVPGQVVTARWTLTGPLAVMGYHKDDDEYFSETRLWDMDEGQPIGEEIVLSQNITCADISVDGTLVAISTEDGVIAFVDAASGRPLPMPSTGNGRLNSLRFSPDGKRLVTAGEDGTARVVDVATGSLVADPLVHGAAIWFAQFSPDNNRIVTTSLDGTARVWSPDGQRIAECRHTEPVEYAELSPDGKMLVTASADRTARIWDARDGRPLLAEPLEHEAVVITARFSRDSQRVVTASADNTAQVWDAATGLRLGDALRHPSDVVSAAFSDDSRKVITASLAKTATIWEVPVVEAVDPMWLKELPPLAEAVGRLRLDSNGVPVPVPWGEFASVKARFRPCPPDDPLAMIARRCLGD